MSVGNLLKKTYRNLGSIKRKITAFRGASRIADQDSCYPELNRKSRAERVRENRRWALKYGEVNQYYNVYGFDIKGFRDQSQHIDYYSFMESRNQLNGLNNFWSYVVLLRDKYLFYTLMKNSGIPTPEVFAVSVGGTLHDAKMNIIPWSTLETEKDYFVKSIDGECASFVKHVRDYADFIQSSEEYKTVNLVFQRRITQSADMAAIYPEAINTIRIVTVNKDGNPNVLTSVLRIGTKQTGNVDNWSAGGIAVGINHDGTLKQHGLYKPGFGTRTDIHPDTGIVFSSFRIPEYEKACELVIKAHRLFYGIAAIGWDVAISENGPCIIEGNDNFAINLHQACDRPFKKEWQEICSR